MRTRRHRGTGADHHARRRGLRQACKAKEGRGAARARAAAVSLALAALSLRRRFGGRGGRGWVGWAQADGEARRGAARAEPEQAILAYCTGAPAPERLLEGLNSAARGAAKHEPRQGGPDSEITSAIPGFHAVILPVIPAGDPSPAEAGPGARKLKTLQSRRATAATPSGFVYRSDTCGFSVWTSKRLNEIPPRGLSV